MSFEYLFI